MLLETKILISTNPIFWRSTCVLSISQSYHKPQAIFGSLHLIEGKWTSKGMSILRQKFHPKMRAFGIYQADHMISSSHVAFITRFNHPALWLRRMRTGLVQDTFHSSQGLPPCIIRHQGSSYVYFPREDFLIRYTTTGSREAFLAGAEIMVRFAVVDGSVESENGVNENGEESGWVRPCHV